MDRWGKGSPFEDENKSREHICLYLKGSAILFVIIKASETSPPKYPQSTQAYPRYLTGWLIASGFFFLLSPSSLE